MNAKELPFIIAKKNTLSEKRKEASGVTPFGNKQSNNPY